MGPLDRRDLGDITANAEEALQFYKKKRGTGPQAQDISTFFNRRTVDQEFVDYWRGPDNKQKGNSNPQWLRWERRSKESMAGIVRRSTAGKAPQSVIGRGARAMMSPPVAGFRRP